MILTADSTVALETNRRRTGNGWNTAFIGKNRNTLKEGEAPPDANIVYPMAFLVEKDAAAIVKPHFHSADQYQVDRAGRRPPRHARRRRPCRCTTPTPIPRTVRSSPPTKASPGSRCATPGIPARGICPPQRQQLRDARARFQHREATCGPLAPLTDAELRRADGCRRQRGDRGDEGRSRHLALHGRARMASREGPTRRRAAGSSGWSAPGPRGCRVARCCR